MAIIDNTQNKEQNQQQQQSQQQASASSSAPAFNLNAGNLFGSPIARGIGSEYYNKLKEQLVKTCQNTNDKNIEISILDLDNVNESALRFSALVLALRFKNEPRGDVAFHVLLLERTGDKLQSYDENLGAGRIVKVTRVTSDAMDKVLLSKAYEKVKAEFRDAANYIMVDGTVVGSLFNIEDPKAVQNLALNAALACSQELTTRKPDFRDVNMKETFGNALMSVAINYGRQDYTDYLGNPMRSDFRVNFMAASAQQGQARNIVNTGDREKIIAEVSGFLNPIIVNPADFANRQQFYGYPAERDSRIFAPEIVLTNLSSEFSLTPGTMLLALAAAQTLSVNNNWIQILRPAHTREGEVDLTDIGALNYEARVGDKSIQPMANVYGEYVNTKSADFGLEQLGFYVNQIFQNAALYSIDVPRFGAQSWYLSVFSAAAMNRPHAYETIIKAANDLTSGAFSQFFKHGEPIFKNSDVQVFLGHWTDNNHRLRDIREIDYTAVANLMGERNPSAMRDWSDTFWRTDVPAIERMAQRREMIMAMTNQSAEITGIADRLTFSDQFLMALRNATQATGVPVRVNAGQSANEFNNQRGYASFAAGAMVPTGPVFAQGGQAHAAAYGYGMPYVSRY